MKLLVNGKEIKNQKDLGEALKFENQKGQYAEIAYIPEEKKDYQNPVYKEMSIDPYISYILWRKNEKGDYEQIGVQYTFHNWYDGHQECLKVVNGIHCYDEELSIKYHTKRLLKLLKEDGIIIPNR